MTADTFPAVLSEVDPYFTNSHMLQRTLFTTMLPSAYCAVPVHLSPPTGR